MITEKDIDENSMTGDLIHSIFFFYHAYNR